MAKFMKRSIAMLLVLNMLTGMIPAQALAAEGDSGAKATVVVKSKSSSKSKSSKSKSSKSSSSKKSSSTKSSSKKTAAKLTASAGEPAPSSMEEPKFDSQLTTGEGINKVEQPVEENKAKDEFGNDVTTTSQTTTTDGKVDVGDGVLADIEGKETYTESITTNPEGLELGSFWELDGSEKVEWTIEDLGNGPQTPVEVEIIPGETTTGSAVIESTITGGIKTGEGDTQYDYTITTETERTVTVEASDVETTVNDAQTGIVDEEKIEIKGIKPEYDEMDGQAVDAAGKEDVFDRNYLSSKTLDYVNINGVHIWVDKGSKTIVDVVKPEGTELPESDMLKDVNVGASVTHWYPSSNSFAKKLFPEGTTYAGGVKTNEIANWYDDEGNLIVTVPDGADFRYVGTGEHSKFYNAYVTVIYKKDEETGETVYDENGDPVIESIQKSNGTIVKIDGVPATELPDGVSLEPIFDDYNGSRPTTFMLMDKDGNRVYAYCSDIVTGAASHKWYSIANLEDTDYYVNEESEEHIRTIIMNGYWGTSDMPQEDGSYKMGSLEKIKQDLKQAITDGKMPDEVEIFKLDDAGNRVLDADGKPVMETVFMTEIIDDLSAGEALLATQSAIWSYSNGHFGAQNGQDGVLVIDPDGYKWNHVAESLEKNGFEQMDDFGSARVDFLYNWLIGLQTKEESTVVINDKNFIDDMSITIHDKSDAEEHKEINADDKQDNDVYNTDLNFTLAFIPGEKDDLLVQITYGTGENTQTIVKRLAGENGEGETYEGVERNKDGSYVIKNLQLSENQDWGFDLRLEGTQYLENGVYVYQAVGGRDVSQTFVGMAEGERNVDVTVGMTIKFDVDENNHVVAERHWHNEKDPKRTPSDNPPPARYRLTQGVGQLEIIDEEVPLAEPPQTGDISMLWFAMIMMSGLGLCMLNLLEKKKREEA